MAIPTSILYTQANLNAVEQAIIDLATGARKVSVNWSDSGGSRSVSYQSGDLPMLKSLRDMIASGLAGTSRSILTQTASKGL